MSQLMRYAVVTGCSKSSIGFLAAKTLASQHKFHVILACRSDQKGMEAQELIKSDHPDSSVTYVKLNLASFSSIETFVKKVHELDNGAIKKQGLDLLVNNAGVGWAGGSKTPIIYTVDGLEEIVGVNHFGTFFLTNLLLDDLKRRAAQAEDDTANPSRIVVLTSSLHKLDSKQDDDEEQLLLPSFPEGIVVTKPEDGKDHDNDVEKDFDGEQAYRISKLCNLWFTYELHRQLVEEEEASGNTDSAATTTSVVVNALSPGFIPSTGLSRRSSAFGKFMLKFVLEPLRYFGILDFVRSPEDGAKAIVEASVGNVACVGGQYLLLPNGSDQLKAIKSSMESYDMDKAAELWKLSKQRCKQE